MTIVARALLLLGAAPCAALVLHCSSFSEGSSSETTVDAAQEATTEVEAAAPLPPDAAVEQDGGCRPPAAPTNLCFVKGGPGCTLAAVNFGNLQPSSPLSNPLAYPHHPVRWGNHIFVAVQDNTVAGRNAGGPGYIVRVDVPSMSNPTIVTDLLQQPAALAVNERYLYWRTVTGSESRIERIDLTAATALPCSPNTCGRETVASVAGAKVEEIFPRSPHEVYFRFGASTLYRVTRAAGGWETAAPILTGTAPSAIAGSFWATQSAETKTTYLYDLLPTEPAVISSWANAGTRWLASACGEAYLYESESDRPFSRVVFAKDGVDGGLSSLPCKGCNKALVFGASVDTQFVYVAAPNAGYLRAIPRSGGDAVTLTTGDVWDVINDDDAVYFTTMGTPAYLGRISKR
ncbi:MAG: hypothetical protein J0I07_13365 [Myxococcales bacterium]|nr:hypothetical protein [Myxococcales bacterium]